VKVVHRWSVENTLEFIRLAVKMFAGDDFQRSMAKGSSVAARYSFVLDFFISS